MKDKTRYEVQFCDNSINDWYILGSDIESKKKAKDIVRDCKRFDREDGKEFKYRILKLTIKREVVK